MRSATEGSVRIRRLRSQSVKRGASWLFGAVCVPLVASAQAESAPTWERCPKIEQAAARLACYDEWARRQLAESDQKIPSASVPAPSTGRFGLEDRAESAMPATMSSSISGNFEGWFPGDRIKLANGQVWQIADGSSGVVYARDPQVVIRRGALGSFRLEIAGTNRAPRVRRVE